MSRIIQTESGGKLRNHLMMSLIPVLKALEMKKEVDAGAKDMIAFLVICLEKISSTIEESILAWEKRGYWVKADHFRLEWEWAHKHSKGLRMILIQENWLEIPPILADISMKCKTISHSKRFKGIPWDGAYSILEQGK